MSSVAFLSSRSAAKTAATEAIYSSEVTSQARLIRDAITNYSSTLFSACVGILLVPIMLRSLDSAPYGLLLTSTVAASMLPIDLGLGWSVTRAIAKDGGRLTEQTKRFLENAGNVFLYMAALGGLLVFAFGQWFARTHHEGGLPPHVIEWVFLFVGVSFMGDHLLLYVLSILCGLRRFASANLILIAAASARALGILFLLRHGAQVVAIAGWQSLVSVATAVTGIVIVCFMEPELRWSFKVPEWKHVRGHVGFSISSQATMAGTNWMWQVTPFLAGLLRGPASVIPFYLGQRFPLYISILNWKAAAPLFPAASSLEADSVARKKLFLSGTRWVMGVSLPLCIFLWLSAPLLLRLWLGNYPAGTVFVMRLTLAAVLADALGVGALHLLLALGDSKRVLLTIFSGAVVSLGMTLVLLYSVEVRYSIIAFLFAMVGTTSALLIFALQKCDASLRDLFELIFASLIPAMVFTLIIRESLTYIQPANLLSLAAIGILATCFYLMATFYTGMSRAERQECLNLLQSRSTNDALAPTFS